MLLSFKCKNPWVGGGGQKSQSLRRPFVPKGTDLIQTLSSLPWLWVRERREGCKSYFPYQKGKCWVTRAALCLSSRLVSLDCPMCPQSPLSHTFSRHRHPRSRYHRRLFALSWFLGSNLCFDVPGWSYRMEFPPIAMILRSFSATRADVSTHLSSPYHSRGTPYQTELPSHALIHTNRSRIAVLLKTFSFAAVG